MEERLQRIDPSPEIGEPLGQAIGREREAAKRAHTHLATAASRAQLNAIVKRLEGWDLGHVNDADIALAVARTYGQGLRRGQLALVSDDPSALHALRSRVVDVRYQLSALSPAWPATLGALSEELNALRDTLGDFNDLDVLRRFAVEKGGLSPEALGSLTERLATKQAKLRRRAEAEFERLFAETPDAFAARLAAYLRNPLGKLDQRAIEASRKHSPSARSEARASPPGPSARADQKSTASPLTSQSP